MANRRVGAPKESTANGLATFSLHAKDEVSRTEVAALQAQPAAGGPVFGLAGDAQALDPETVARRYLDHALGSAAVPGLVAPSADGTPSVFKSLGVESIPLTGTTMVKFRQNFNNIPVYGSLVAVELDETHNLLAISSALGTPTGVNPIAKISAADAIAVVKKHPGPAKDLGRIVPRLNFYFAKTKWRLVFILEDVPVVPDTKGRSPVLMDYVVDAHTGKVVVALPRTPTVAAQESDKDGLGNSRTIEVDKSGATAFLKDPTLNVQTFDFKFRDPAVEYLSLPGVAIKNPPQFSPAAVSAHANAEVVSTFLRSVLGRNNIDNLGGLMSSSINCVVQAQSLGGKDWINAFWNGQQMVYGQRKVGSGYLSLAVALDVVGHEMMHGVTDRTSRLEYAFQPGALNESYSDIFGVIIANQSNPTVGTWTWTIGAGLQQSGKPFRDMSNPPAYRQPDHMRDFRVLPNTDLGDWGGVHTNSGIHNKAAYNILTASQNGSPVIRPFEVAAMFYLALTQRLSRTSQFSDSRAAVLDSARTLFRALPAPALAEKIGAIAAAFDAVGIK